MKIFDADPNLRWLFCMTHPDDEISICAWIRRLAANGNEVFISWTHHTPTRKVEGATAARMLGVPGDRLIFHAGEDGQICEQMVDLLPSFHQMVQGVRPDRVCCGAFEQGHLDHDATNLLVNKCFDGRILEIPFYHTYLNRQPIVNRFAQPEGQDVLLLKPEEQEFKVNFAKQFPSQDIFRNLVLNEVRRAVTNRKESPLKMTERMRLQTYKDFLNPHLPPTLAEKVRRSPKWARWEQAARAIL